MSVVRPLRDYMTKILFQLNELGFGGTTKAILSFCSHLDRTRFAPYLFFHTDQGTYKQWERKLGSFLSQSKANRYEELYVKNFARKEEFQKIIGTPFLFLGRTKEFERVIEQVKPDIVHFSRGENEDWYTSLNLEDFRPTKFVETNIFGKSSNPHYLRSLDRIFFISQWLLDKSSWAQADGRVIYNPILKPRSLENLRKKLKISISSFVVGRISRPGLDNGLNAYEIFKAGASYDDHYIVVGASQEMMKIAESDLRVHAFPSSLDEAWISQFYNTMDVLLHYRQEGETFGMNIAEAMIHGKPIVSHRSFLDNAQSELILPDTSFACGEVVAQDKSEKQVEQIFNLKKDVDLRLRWGRAGQLRAMQIFEAAAVTRSLENQYLEVCKVGSN